MVPHFDPPLLLRVQARTSGYDLWSNLSTVHSLCPRCIILTVAQISAASLLVLVESNRHISRRGVKSFQLRRFTAKSVRWSIGRLWCWQPIFTQPPSTRLIRNWLFESSAPVSSLGHFETIVGFCWKKTEMTARFRDSDGSNRFNAGKFNPVRSEIPRSLVEDIAAYSIKFHFGFGWKSGCSTNIMNFPPCFPRVGQCGSPMIYVEYMNYSWLRTIFSQYHMPHGYVWNNYFESDRYITILPDWALVGGNRRKYCN